MDAATTDEVADGDAADGAFGLSCYPLMNRFMGVML